MIRTMARVTDVHQLEDEEDGVELPSKIVNEDLRKFFMPKKYAEPEPIPEPVPEVEKAEEKPAEEFYMETESAKEPEKSAAAPVELLRKSEQHAQSPKSAYAPGAFDPRAPTAPMASPAKSNSKWWRLGRSSSKSRMAKESAPGKGSTAQPLRFNDKHSYTQPSTKELLAGERPLQPTPEELHAEADPHVPEPAAAEVAPATAEVAPTAEEDGLVDEVTPAVQDSTAATGEPIAEAVVALQEVMEPAPVPEPVLEEEPMKEAEPEEATSLPVEMEKEEEPIQAVHEAHVEATAHKEEAAPVVTNGYMAEAEMAAPLDAIAYKALPETAQPEEPTAHELPSETAQHEQPSPLDLYSASVVAHEEEEAGHHENTLREVHQVEPEQDHAPVEELAHIKEQAPAEEPEQGPAPIQEQANVKEPITEETQAAAAAAAVEMPVAETKAAERKAITMSMLLNEETDNAEGEHRPVSCRFVVDEDVLPKPASIPETGPMSTQSSPQKEMPINDWYKKNNRKSGKKGRGLFSCFRA